MTDIVKARRENMRWLLLNTLNNARPLGAMDVLVLTVVQEEKYYWIGKFERSYKVDDSNIVYTNETGEPAIGTGYFLIKKC